MSQSKTYPDRKSVQVYQSEHVEKIEDALERAEQRLDDEEPPETEQIAHIADTYLQQSRFSRLADDQRIIEARQVVAKDHGMEPSEISLAELLKITAGAYCGYQRTNDWRPENGDSTGFKNTPRPGDTDA